MPVNNYERSPLSWMPQREQISYPQYLSLAAALERDIVSGLLPVGTRLPPQRALADYLDLNFTTVTRAYELCREKGLIYGEVGRGTYVSPRSQYGVTDKDVIELGVVLGFPDVNQQLVEAARNVLNNRYCKDLFSYRERVGMEHHRAAGVHWMNKRGIITDIDHTMIFAGAQNAIATTLLALFHTGDILLADAFTYANMIAAAKLAHVRVIPVQGDEQGMLPESMDAVCKKYRVTGIFLMPDCANPTTITISERRRDQIAEICRENHLIVIEDDDSLFQQNHQTFYHRLPEQTIYISATTRHIAPGLRTTFVSYPERYRRALMEGLFTTSIKASALDAEILSHIITTEKAEEILKEKSALALKANHIYHSIFPDDPVPENQYAFFRVHELPKNDNGPALEQTLLSHGLRVCHSYRFAVDKKAPRAFLRISLSSARDLSQLEEGLYRLKENLSVHL